MATDQAPPEFLTLGAYLNTQYVTEWCFRGPYSKSYLHPDEIIFTLINPTTVLNLAAFTAPVKLPGGTWGTKRYSWVLIST